MFSREGWRDFWDGLKAEGWVETEPGVLTWPSEPDKVIRYVSGDMIFSPSLEAEMKDRLAKLEESI